MVNNYSTTPVEESFDLSRFLGFNAYDLSSSRTPKTSSYYNLTGSTIVVDDADPNYNWSKTVAENDWCSGSGTLGDPYVIENVYIDGNMSLVETLGKQHSANCLSIYRSTAYFIVRDCYFTKSGTGEFNSGIYLTHVENGILYNNTLAYHNQAISVDSSSNITVLYNVIKHNQNLYGPNRAMYLEFSDDCLVVKNLVVNTYVGIQLFKCVGTEIRQNMLNSSLFGFPVSVGIDFMMINDSKIIFNVFAGDYTGIDFHVSQIGSTGNVIQNNTISGTIPELGTPTLNPSGDYTDLIKLAESNFNTVAHNIAFVPGYVSPTPEIPSYNIFIVLGAIAVVSILLTTRGVKRKIKKI
jgi:parallel beta-helix repeat protein